MRSETKRTLQAIPGVVDVTDSDGGITAHAKNADEIIADVVTALERNNIRPTSLNVSSPTLDDVFLHHTGRRIRPEELGRKPAEQILM